MAKKRKLTAIVAEEECKELASFVRFFSSGKMFTGFK
jgi:hypothetical protein